MKLERLDGKSWNEVVSFLEDSRHALALEGGPEHEVAVIADEYDCEAGAAAAVAYRFCQKHGAACTLYMAIEMYERLRPSDLLTKLRADVAWVSKPYVLREEKVPDGWTGPTMTVRDFTIDWPIDPYCGEDPEKEGGLANVMLAVSARMLSKGSNSEILAAIAVNDFLDEGIRRKRDDENK